ncbi:homeobox protein Hox-B3-like [Gossypium australe]|uniref:Homeobox protein Hox-B3-like n=1 Tax=Gossypium australe TaxID=47621 RepID=A0A5B6VSL6_9ROSI|nr:homeobox protein Hox-B3-like [Gossypium australe]
MFLTLFLSFFRIIPLRLTTESSIMERGPKYGAYTELRETMLRMKSGMMQQEKEEIELKQTPTKKQVKFSSSVGVSRKGSSVLAQSVPDFSATLRKENRKPPVRRGMELTPPPTSRKNWTRENGVWPSNSRGSKSANAGEKKGRMMMLKKSVASVEDLKGISLAVANAINGENRGGKTSARAVAGKGNATLGKQKQNGTPISLDDLKGPSIHSNTEFNSKELYITVTYALEEFYVFVMPVKKVSVHCILIIQLLIVSQHLPPYFRRVYPCNEVFRVPCYKECRVCLPCSTETKHKQFYAFEQVFAYLQKDDTDNRSHRAKLFLVGITPLLYQPMIGK